MNILTGNLTQTLYNLESKGTVTPSDSFSKAYQNMSTLSGVNSMQQEIDPMKPMMSVFLNQSHMSTYYQDNPIPMLSQNTKYGLSPQGGPINCKQPPGYRPGNVC